MREVVEPEVIARIHIRAKGKCECENPRCKHVATIRRDGLNSKSGIMLPFGVDTPDAMECAYPELQQLLLNPSLPRKLGPHWAR
jgi:hypothetical protein